MRFRFWILLLPLLLAGVAHAQLAELYWDMPRAEVISLLGEPESTARGNDREILLYPNGVRVELHEGKVMAGQGVRIVTRSHQGVLPATLPPAAPAPASETAPAAGQPGGRRISTSDNSNTGLSHEEEAYLDQLGKLRGDEAGDQAVDGEDAYDAEMDEWEEQMEAEARAAWYIELIIIFVISVICVKIACETSGIPVFMGTVSLIAFIDAIAQVGMDSISMSGDWGLVFSATKLEYVIPLIVMMVNIHQFTSGKSFPTVVRIALIAQFLKLIAWLVIWNLLLATMH